MAGTRHPHPVRDGRTVYGSATLADDQRVGPGSTFETDAVDIRRDEIKSFGFRGDVQGSWFIDVAFRGERFRPYSEGTFPAGPGGGTIDVRSFTETFARARARVRLSQVGSVNVFYGGQVTYTP